ncbi:MarR family transcriptional regulator [Demequina pelophila]|uniref:MarR family transcriptional regulator n=1 Tax=Demequina pelophila TaxID=1638984 RepID=UPI0007809B06|nr:MarR family transcriptional regulator [Demequina pelophila]
MLIDVTDSTIVASRALLGIVARSMSPALEEVTVPQFRVLVVLSNKGGMRMGDLAEQIGVHPSTLTRTVERLEQNGFILRSPVPGNRREIRVSLEERGAALVETVTQARRATILSIIETLPAEEQETVKQGMTLFARAAGEPDPADLLELGI